VEPRGIERVETPDELLLLYNPCSRKLKLLKGEKERRETRDERRAVALESVQQQVEAVEAPGRPETVKTRDELLALQPPKKKFSLQML
jgi:hypothetical protein